MKIGIDAKWYFDGPPSGKVVVRNIIDSIIGFERNAEIFLFLDKRYNNTKHELNNKGINLEYIWSGNNLISNIFCLRKRANDIGVDVVLYQNFTSLFTKYKQIAYIHDALYLSHPQFYGFKEKIYLSPLKFLAKRSDLIITISESERDRLIKHKFQSKENIEVVYHGVNKLFKPKSEFTELSLTEVINKYELPENYLLYVGRLNERKNIKNLLIAFSKIKNKEWMLIIIGKVDNKFKNVDALIYELGIKKRVRFLGYIDDTDMYKIYSMAKIFCFPSFAEGFGLPVVEAMASGVPVLTSNVTSLPEVGGDAAIYVDPENYNEIADKIDLLINDISLRDKMKELGLKRSKYFLWENSARKILDLCYKLNEE